MATDPDGSLAFIAALPEAERGRMAQFAVGRLDGQNLPALLHTAAMGASGLGLAWIVYRYLGLRALRSAWLNLDAVWALGLIASGLAAVGTALLLPP